MPRDVGQPRTSFQLLFDKDYGKLIWGRLGSSMAFWAQTLVVATLTYAATGSAAWVGLVGAAQFVPQIIFSLHMGKFADQYGPQRQMIIGSLTCAASSFALAILTSVFGTEGGHSYALMLFVTSLFSGFGFSMTAPAIESIAPKLVSPAELPSAVALNYLPTALGRAIGPAGGALMATAVNPSIALAAAGAAHLVFTVAIVLITMPKREFGRPTADQLRILSALSAVWHDRRLRGMVLGVAVVGFSVEPALTLAPAIAELFGSGVGGAGRIASGFGAGSLVGVILHKLVQHRIASEREGWIGLMVIGCSMGAVAASPSLAMSTVAMGVAGASMLMSVTGFSITVQQICPPAMLGRVMALWLVAFAGIRPFAGLLQGFVADHLSTRTALVATAVVVVVASWAGIWNMRTSLTDNLRPAHVPGVTQGKVSP